jgi:hypothetical protein
MLKPGEERSSCVEEEEGGGCAVGSKWLSP